MIPIAQISIVMAMVFLTATMIVRMIRTKLNKVPVVAEYRKTNVKQMPVAAVLKANAMEYAQRKMVPLVRTVIQLPLKYAMTGKTMMAMVQLIAMIWIAIAIRFVATAEIVYRKVQNAMRTVRVARENVEGVNVGKILKIPKVGI